MMMRQMLAVAVCVLACPAAWLAADEPSGDSDQKQAKIEQILATKIVVPEGVTYKKTTSEENRKAIEKLSNAFLATDAKNDLPTDLFAEAMICGTGLWRNIKADPEMKKIDHGQVQINVPTKAGKQALEGKLFQNKEELAAFWRAFRRKYKFDAKATIRRPTAEELELYWAMIPYDITEPIFIVESPDAILLAHFMAKDLKIAWIDDFKDMRFVRDK